VPTKQQIQRVDDAEEDGELGRVEEQDATGMVGKGSVAAPC